MLWFQLGRSNDTQWQPGYSWKHHAVISPLLFSARPQLLCRFFRHICNPPAINEAVLEPSIQDNSGWQSDTMTKTLRMFMDYCSFVLLGLENLSDICEVVQGILNSFHSLSGSILIYFAMLAYISSRYLLKCVNGWNSRCTHQWVS